MTEPDPLPPIPIPPDPWRPADPMPSWEWVAQPSGGVALIVRGVDEFGITYSTWSAEQAAKLLTGLAAALGKSVA